MKHILILISFLIAFLLRFFLIPAPETNYSPGQEINWIVTLISEPQIFEKTQKFQVKGLWVITGRYPQYEIGEKLKISGFVSRQDNGVLKKRNGDLRLFFPKIEIMEKEKRNWFFWGNWRRNLVELYQKLLPEPEASLMAGIVLGIKTTLPPDFKEVLEKTGTMHIVAASGMNVTMVSGFLMAGLVFFPRKIATVFAILGIFFYALLAGFAPSIIRAAIMGTIALIAEIFGRQNWGVLNLILVGYLMLILKPLIIFDIGFQLSFLATAGLLILRPIIKEKIRLRLIGDDLATTLAAQIATLPILLINFGQYSLLSILVNALSLWTIPWIMGFGGVIGLLDLIFPFLAQILAFLVFPFLFYFKKTVEFFGSLTSFGSFNFLMFKIESFSWQFFLGYYCLLVSFLIWRSKWKKSN